MNSNWDTVECVEEQEACDNCIWERESTKKVVWTEETEYKGSQEIVYREREEEEEVLITAADMAEYKEQEEQ